MLRLGVGVPSYHALMTGGPALDLNYAARGALYPFETFGRSSIAERFNASGVLEQIASGLPVFDYDPSTLAARGLRIEESRTNSIRNSTMQGAVAGTPGTTPTQWTTAGAPNGLSSQVVGSGVENGIPYLDYRLFGTTTAGGSTGLFFDSPTQIAAASGQTWTASVYLKLIGGSLANLTNVQSYISERDNTGASLIASNTVCTPTGAPLQTQRVPVTRAFNQATTAFAISGFLITYNISAAVDVTLRIGLPQLEQGAFATSPIPTSGAAVTRAADADTIALSSVGIPASPSGLTIIGKARTASGFVSGTNQNLFQFDDGTANNRIFMRRLGASGNIDIGIVVGGVFQSAVPTTYAASPNDTDLRFFVSMQAGSMSAQIVGQTLQSGAPAALPTGLSAFSAGLGAAASQWNSTIARLQIRLGRLPDPTAAAIAASL